MKEQKLARASYRPLRLYANYAISVWGNRSVKTIGYAEIEDFLTKSLKHLSSKSQSNAKSALHDFFAWLRKRRLITHDQVPEFPVIDVCMKMRNLVDKATQGAILDKLREMSWKVNPRIWIAVKWLSTYFSIRPGEMLSLKEENIDAKIGVIFVQPAGDKNREGKIIELLAEDVELVRSLPRGFPHMPFFRHVAAHSRAKPGDRFHHDLLMRWWGRACEAVGVEGVSLYPGTKHSSVTALGKDFTPEQIRTASQISTNKAFMRYFRPSPTLVRSIYSSARGDTGEAEGDTNRTSQILTMKGKVVNLRENE